MQVTIDSFGSARRQARALRAERRQYKMSSVDIGIYN